jgi:serine/threonine protein kinase
VKVVRPEVVAADPQAFQRFTQELRLTRHVTHRNVVRTHDLGEVNGVPFLTMEYVHGASLSSVIAARGRLAAPAVLAIAKQLLRALAVTHEQGIIHGDLKPQNLLIGANGVLKVTDFGVARLVRGAAPVQEHAAAHAANAALVARFTGAVVGTPEYMAPEQLRGAPATEASDIYAAGIVLYECLTGVSPFEADTPFARSHRTLNWAAASQPTGRGTIETDATTVLTAELQDLVGEMTRADPAERPASAEVLVERLKNMG